MAKYAPSVARTVGPRWCWNSNATESFRIFQSKVLDEYDQIVSEFGLRVVDAAGSITDQQQTLRQLVSANLEIAK